MYPLRRVNFTWTIRNGSFLRARVTFILRGPDGVGKDWSASFFKMEAGLGGRVCGNMMPVIYT